ncbi:hypothetical protein K0M31_014285 [Melipona bicolor]|uniref:Uncharacterized protein n=1 Tax=Melipona bicolor TaxID=60889 RepID=A0AA40KU63_9HYME|nr:hypothetical protein K0M31_014285 [Melipona bicolor]
MVSEGSRGEANPSGWWETSCRGRSMECNHRIPWRSFGMQTLAINTPSVTIVAFHYPFHCPLGRGHAAIKSMKSWSEVPWCPQYPWPNIQQDDDRGKNVPRKEQRKYAWELHAREGGREKEGEFHRNRNSVE